MSIESSTDPQAFTRFEHDGWEAKGRGYNDHFARLTRQSVDALLDAAGVGEDTRLLDVCCGPGMISAAALERGARVTGLDFSTAMLDIARAGIPGAEFQQGDAQSLPFDDERFDAVVCGFGVIHLPDPARAFAEMHRVLRPGKQAAVSVWQAPGPGNGFGLLYGTLKAHADLDVGLPHGPDFFQFSGPGSLARALLQNGFREPSTVDVAQFWEFGTAEDFLTGVMEGGVRAPGIIDLQSDAVRQTIAQVLAAGMAAWIDDGETYRLPMPAIVGSALK